MCAQSRIGSETKVDQLEQLYKILLQTPTLTQITLVNAVRLYRVSPSNFYSPKIIFNKFLATFRLFSCSISAKQKNNHKIWFRNKQVINF